MDLKTTTRILHPLVFVSLLPALAGLAWLASSDPAYRRHLGVLAVYGLVLGLIARFVRRTENVLLALATLHLVVLTPEVLLRVGGFHHESGIRFGYPRPSGFTYFEVDESLFWTLPAEDPGVNSWGFRGPEIRSPKPAGVFRVVVLGDSVAYQGYPAILGELLPAAPAYEVVNLGLSGYSSHQGRVLAEKYADRLEADLVVVAYGWNDHWLAWGEIDADKEIRVDDSLAGRLGPAIYRRLRLLQALRWLATPILGAEGPTDRPRVPPDDYRRNLTAIARGFAGRGARVLFVTAPSSHAVTGVPGELIELGLATDAESVHELHRAYNEIVREVARAEGRELLDLAVYAERSARLEELFLDDGIHLTDEGLAWIARHLAEVINPR